MNFLTFKNDIAMSNGVIMLGSNVVAPEPISPAPIVLGKVLGELPKLPTMALVIENPLSGVLTLDGKGQHPPLSFNMLPKYVERPDWECAKDLKAELAEGETLHEYADGHRANYLRFFVLERADGKTFEFRTYWQAPRGDGVWLNRAPPLANRPLFNLEKIIDGGKSARIIVLPNERAVREAEDDNRYFYMVHDRKITFTVIRGVSETDLSPLKGRDVTVVGRPENYPGLDAKFVEQIEDAVKAEPTPASVVVVSRPVGRPREHFHISEYGLNDILSKFPCRGQIFTSSTFKGARGVKVAPEGRDDPVLCIHIDPDPKPKAKNWGFRTQNFARPDHPWDAEPDRQYVIERLSLGPNAKPVELSAEEKRRRQEENIELYAEYVEQRRLECEVFKELYANTPNDAPDGPAISYLRDTRKVTVDAARTVYHEIIYLKDKGANEERPKVIAPRPIIVREDRPKLIVPRCDFVTGETVGFELSYLAPNGAGGYQKCEVRKGQTRVTIGRNDSYMRVREGRGTLAVGEGYITTLSAAALPLHELAGAQIWALGSGENFKHITAKLPYDHFILFVDTDASETGERAAVDAGRALLRAGKRVTLVRCPLPEGHVFAEGEKPNWDFNDVIKRGPPFVEGIDFTLERKEKASRVIVKVRGNDKHLRTLEDLDREYAILIASKGESAYVVRKTAQPLKEIDLRRRLADSVVETGLNNGVPVYTPAFDFWTGNAYRHIYRRVVFTNREVAPDEMNLFTGFGVEAREGQCDLLLNHIHIVICAGNDTDNNRMLDLMAWQAQNIGIPSRVIVFLLSIQQQVGKGVLIDDILKRIYGEAGFITTKSDQALGRFNDLLRGVAYGAFDEALFAGDHKAVNELKGLATTTSYPIESKGVPIITCPVAVNLWMASNHENGAFLEEKDDRHWILRVSEEKHGDVEYFADLYREIENGGREAFLHYLLTRDVSDFVPWRDVPKDNAAKRAMTQASRNDFSAQKWLEDCVNMGELIGMHVTREVEIIEKTEVIKLTRNRSPENEEWVEGKEYPVGRLRDAYLEWQRGTKSPRAAQPTATNKFGQILAAAGFKRRVDHNDRSHYTLPARKVCEKNLNLEG